jgi:histidinol-phosphate aminotransferase
VLVRDRSNDPGCDGCVRITVGTQEHTRQGIGALREALREIGWRARTPGGKP